MQWKVHFKAFGFLLGFLKKEDKTGEEQSNINLDLELKFLSLIDWRQLSMSEIRNFAFWMNKKVKEPSNGRIIKESSFPSKMGVLCLGKAAIYKHAFTSTALLSCLSRMQGSKD